MKKEQLVQLGTAELNKNREKLKGIIIFGAIAWLLFFMMVLYLYYSDPNQWLLLNPSLSLCSLSFY